MRKGRRCSVVIDKSVPLHVGSTLTFLQTDHPTAQPLECYLPSIRLTVQTVRRECKIS